MYLLDTSVVSELRKVRSGKANAGVAEWASVVAAARMFISVMTVHELEYGVLLAERSDPRKGEVLRTWLDRSVVAAFSGRVVPVFDAIARRAASLHVPDPAPLRDAFIGATALTLQMTVVTRNVRDFERFPGLQILNPWI